MTSILKEAQSSRIYFNCGTATVSRIQRHQGAGRYNNLNVRTIHPHVELVSVKVIDTAVVAFTVFQAQVDCHAPAPVLLPV